jgi:hypothetical protein
MCGKDKMATHLFDTQAPQAFRTIRELEQKTEDNDKNAMRPIKSWRYF